MNIIYISVLSSKRLVNLLYEQTGQNPGFAVQKFSRLIVNGLVSNNNKVMALSNPPSIGPNSKKIWIYINNEVENEVRYNYIPYLNFSFIKHICVFIYTFFYILFWGLRNRKEKCVICDSLSISASIAALCATRINRVKCAGVFTDIYGFMISSSSDRSLLKRIAIRLNKSYSHLFTHFVLLTEEMNNLVNPNRRPYIVMEALCDIEEYDLPVSDVDKHNPPIILYAGGIEEKYGLKMLTDAFLQLKNLDAELHVYGSGSFVPELQSKCLLDSRLKYKGVQPNLDVVAAERRATILVNPRFTSEEFTKYSFPSKNMEYMVSGTPVLTTKLPGMPKEYNNFVYFISEETIEGYKSAISSIMEMQHEVLKEQGNRARRFVLEEKNNIKQTERIVNLLES